MIEKSIKPKTRKLFKSKKSKSKKLFKFQKSAKLKKKLSKNKYSPNFKDKKNRLSFLISKARITFKYLWLTFIKTLIF